MFDDLDDDSLLTTLDTEWRKFTKSDPALMHQMIDELVCRGVYPAKPAEGNPNTVYQMVDGWGARWHVWREPIECPHCRTDLRDHRTGPPGKREIGLSNRESVYAWKCPDCGRDPYVRPRERLA